MNKKPAFVLALLITLLIANTVYLASLQKAENKRQTIIIARVIDGDTFKASDGRSIRLANVNAPEKNTPNADLSKNLLEALENSTVQIDFLGQDKYGRTLARVYGPGYINLRLVQLGLSSKFLVNEKELKQFASAEKEAIVNAKGMWQHSPYFNCISARVFPFEEKVALKDICSSNISGLHLKDESRKIYYFNTSFTRINLHSGKGQNNATDLFWGSATDIWNNDRDSIYIFDQNEKIVYSSSYGY